MQWLYILTQTDRRDRLVFSFSFIAIGILYYYIHTPSSKIVSFKLKDTDIIALTRIAGGRSVDGQTKRQLKKHI